MYKEYEKKIKAKNEKSFFESLINIEKEKLYYFILTYNQRSVLVKTGEKDAEKQFLGYEFSNRRGSEGIHAIQRGKTIEECTRLFDAETFDNPKKASTYIYQAFNGDYETLIDSSLSDNVSRVNLVDLLTFDRVDFEKTISTNSKKKVKIESKWPLVKIRDVCEIGRGRVISKKEINNNFGEYPVYSSQTSNNGIFGKINSYDFDGEYITWTTDGIYAGSVFYRNGKFNCTNVCGTLKIKQNNLLAKYISYVLPIYTALHVVKVANPKLMNNVMANIQIPLPNIEVQEKIVSEIEVIEKLNEKALKNIEDNKELIKHIINNTSTNLKIYKLNELVLLNTETKNPLSLDTDYFTYVDIDSVGKNNGFINYTKKIPTTEAPSRARQLAKRDSVIISTVRPNLKGFALC